MLALEEGRSDYGDVVGGSMSILRQKKSIRHKTAFWKGVSSLIRSIGDSHNYSVSSGGHTLISGEDEPLRFHNVHGENVHLEGGGCRAVRSESFCKGILFSHRPVAIKELVAIRIAEVSNRWSGMLRLGFTTHDPVHLDGHLPKYACPDLTSKPGFWAKAIPEHFLQSTDRNSIIHFYLTSKGDVHVGVNGEKKGIFLSGVAPKMSHGQKVWALIDLYGNCNCLEMVDTQPLVSQLNDPMRSEGRSHLAMKRHSRRQTETTKLLLAAVRQHQQRQHQSSDSLNFRSTDRMLTQAQSVDVIARQQSRLETVCSHSLSAMNEEMHSLSLACNNNQMSQPVASCSNASLCGTVMHAMFHGRVGANISLNPDQRIAHRHRDEFACGYVFLDCPLIDVDGQVTSSFVTAYDIVVRVVETEPSYIGCLGFGLTNVDPATVEVASFPDDSSQIVESLSSSTHYGRSNGSSARPSGWWRTAKDVGGRRRPQISLTDNIIVDDPPRGGCELTFNVDFETQSVTLTTSTSADKVDVVDWTDSTYTCGQSVWPFFDLYGHTVGLQLVEVRKVRRLRYVPPTLPSSSSTVVDLDSTAEHGRSSEGNECTICFERPVDCTLYTCGHMCMCHQCALVQWLGPDRSNSAEHFGLCPICREPILDVIRTFKA